LLVTQSTLLIYLLLYGSLLFAEQVNHASSTETTGISFWSIQYENDFLGERSDKYYTQGIELSFSQQSDIPDFLLGIASYLATQGKIQQQAVTYSFGQKVFTPDNLQTENLQTNDRPYAGYLYGAITYLNVVDTTANKQHVNFLELSLGVVGPSALGEEMQNFLHQLIDKPVAEGWQHQLDDELAIGAAYSHKWRNFFNLKESKQTELSPHGAIVIGNVYSYIAGGIMFRWGQGLKRDIGPPNIRPGFIGSAYFSPHPDTRWYLFLGHEARLIGKNIFLDGNTNVHSHKVDSKPLVGDLILGFAIQKDNMRLAFSHITRSKEFEGQADHTQFGSINFSFYF